MLETPPPTPPQWLEGAVHGIRPPYGLVEWCLLFSLLLLFLLFLLFSLLLASAVTACKSANHTVMLADKLLASRSGSWKARPKARATGRLYLEEGQPPTALPTALGWIPISQAANADGVPLLVEGFPVNPAPSQMLLFLVPFQSSEKGRRCPLEMQRSVWALGRHVAGCQIRG